ncbi:hypothetical protein ARMGADRAFT_446739 [Armillaria gallica]|uniref:Uncharacterized protein n=1 Tax=Armillaria gallica TaxID=47427 RepID=A0A2H3D299_ARMGA|nr:hypothetical protein ARMGADRAFT_446739 [Armillaria gallica]
MTQGTGQDSKSAGRCWTMDRLPESKVLSPGRWTSPTSVTHHHPSPTLSLPLPCPSPVLFLHSPSRAPYELGYIVGGRLSWSDFALMSSKRGHSVVEVVEYI